MHGHDVTTIALSRIKILVLLGGAIAFVLLGAWMLGLDEADLPSGRFGNPWLVQIMGIASIAFFGLMGLLIVRKLLDPKPGLVLSSAGLTDNASGVAAGFIPWAEIEGSGEFAVQGQRMLVIHVRDPHRYVERGGAIRRTVNRANFKLAGSPIAIPASALRVGFDELQSLFDRYLKQYGSGAARTER
ncbi:MAG TPA: STM3941 family protein [Xanthomonadaceae bacterium]|nr:STM3941 family protein [Xanthomonadaceae bacterium]